MSSYKYGIDWDWNDNVKFRVKAPVEKRERYGTYTFTLFAVNECCVHCAIASLNINCNYEGTVTWSVIGDITKNITRSDPTLIRSFIQ